MRDDTPLEEETFDEFMQTAEADGLFGADIEALTADPWLGLVAMYANFGREITTGWQSGRPFTKTQAIAEHLIEQYPDDPVGDYARLLFIHTMNGQQNKPDAPDTQHHLVELLYGASDPLVIQASLEELGRMEHTEEDPTIENGSIHITHSGQLKYPRSSLGRLTHHSTANNRIETQNGSNDIQTFLDQTCTRMHANQNAQHSMSLKPAPTFDGMVGKLMENQSDSACICVSPTTSFKTDVRAKVN